jgi:hypothetical protein
MNQTRYIALVHAHLSVSKPKYNILEIILRLTPFSFPQYPICFSEKEATSNIAGHVTQA